MRLVLAQINTTVGDLDGNRERIEAIEAGDLNAIRLRREVFD